jgi:hypothetical protein
MAPNCAASGYDLKAVTSYNKFQCIYEGTGLIDGKRVRRKDYTMSGTLPSCDGMSSMGEITDEVMQSIQMYAWHKAGGKEAALDPKQFICSVQSLPLR